MEEAALNGSDGEGSSALGVGLGACVGSPWGGVSAPPEWVLFPGMGIRVL